jgi:hypothetical protein
LGKLRPQHRLELLGNLAPRLARTGARRSFGSLEAVLSRRSILATRSRATRSAAAAGGLPGTDIGIAVDSAAAAPAVALSVDRGVVTGPAAARPAATSLAAARSCTPATPLAAALLGDQVFGDLRLVEVLVVGSWPDRCRLRAGHAELRVPDGPERIRSRGTRCRRDLDVVFLLVDVAFHLVGE